MAFVIGSNGFIGSHMLGIEDPGLIFMAGISDTACEDDKALAQANVRGPLQWATDAAAQGLPFIFPSSASVYGNQSGPLNRYAISKACLDVHMSTRPGRWYGLRFFNVYGPGEDHKGKQASIVSRLASGTLSEVFEPDTARDFVHVSDCVKVARWMLQAAPPSGIYDVGTGASRSIREVIGLAGATVNFVDMPEHLKGKYQFNTRADLTKLRAAGYVEPFLSLEEGMKLYG